MSNSLPIPSSDFNSSEYSTVAGKVVNEWSIHSS